MNQKGLRAWRLARIGMVVVAALAGAGAAVAHDAGQPIRILSMHDPFARAWSEHPAMVRERLGLALEITLLDYESSNRAIAVNAARRVSAYDLVAIDVVWMGHYGGLEALLPLDQLLAARDVAPDDFIALAWQGGRVGERQLAVPIQPHPEVLIYRRSVLAQLEEPPPQTSTQLLRVARRISEEIPGMHGICWNAASGAALGQQMLHFAGAFGGRILDQDGRFSVADPAWEAAFDYAQQLVTVSPPTIRDMAWDVRINHFRMGSCGMSYAWGARTAQLEAPDSAVAGDIGYAPAPVGPGQKPMTPMGAWLLGVPANLDPERLEAVADALALLTGSEGAAMLLELGVSALPGRMDDSADRYPVLDLVDQLDLSRQLTTDMRPAVPAFQALSEIIGVEVHAALFGSASRDQVLDRIARRIRELDAASQ